MRWFPAKRRTRIAVLLVLVAGCLLWWVWSYRPRGAHYRGRPASWWAREIVAEYERRQPQLRGAWKTVGGAPKGNNSSSFWTWLKGRLAKAGLHPEINADDWDDFMLDPGATPVVLELLHHPNPDVRMVATWNDQQDAAVIRATILALADQVAHSPDVEKRLDAVGALQFRFFKSHPEAFDAEVRPIVFASLVEALRVEYLRDKAFIALVRIDIDASRRAGIIDASPRAGILKPKP